MQYTVDLANRRAMHASISGGKGAGLSWLQQHNLPVPPGFVITPAAFRDMLATLQTAPPKRMADWTEEELEQSWRRLLASAFPARVSTAILRAYRQLGGAVAVRSSYIAEDTGTASFAGQFDTVLNVQNEGDLLEAVKVCWASLFSARLSSYLRERGAALKVPHGKEFDMAVVVQRMIAAQAAGIAFGADPITGQRQVVIEAVRGLGDALAQGKVTPDRYVVDARGVLSESMPADPGAPVLPDEQVKHLAGLVRRVSREMQEPQDIEWAWDGNSFFLLQVRPISTLVGKTVYSNHMVSEMIPGLITPLVCSTNVISMARHMFGHIFAELLGPTGIDYGEIIALIHSRVYVNMTLFGDLLQRLGLPANFFEWMARDEEAEKGHPPMNLRTLRTFLRLLAFGWRNSRAAPAIEAFISQHQRELLPFRERQWSSCSSEELLAAYEELAQMHIATEWYTFLAPMNMMVRNRLVTAMVQHHAPEVVPSDLVRGLVGMKALEPNNELQDLAQQASALPADIRQLLATRDDSTIRTALSESIEGRSFLEKVDAFLQRHGFLSSVGTNFAVTPWLENPIPVWHSIGRASGNPAPRIVKDNEAIRNASTRLVRSRLRWANRIYFDRMLASSIRYIDLRERTSLLLSEDSFHMRRIFLALGDRLRDRGYMKNRDDIFFLTYPEVRQCAIRALQPAIARDLIRERRAAMDDDAQIELPDTLCGDAIVALRRAPADAEYLVGISGSSGLADGRARVVLDPLSAPADLTKDDILIVPFTDVSWTPLLCGIGGVVAETGGQLCHTSIVAREYGLPAVVSVKKATRLIRPGRPIRIDGNQGRVYLK